MKAGEIDSRGLGITAVKGSVIIKWRNKGNLVFLSHAEDLYKLRDMCDRALQYHARKKEARDQ